MQESVQPDARGQFVEFSLVEVLSGLQWIRRDRCYGNVSESRRLRLVWTRQRAKPRSAACCWGKKGVESASETAYFLMWHLVYKKEY